MNYAARRSGPRARDDLRFQPIDASLAFAISFILLWLFLMWLLYRKRIYVKV